MVVVRLKTKMDSRIYSKETLKKLLKPFILLFLINFLIFNWNSVSWIFNYKVISGAISDFSGKISGFFAEIEDKTNNLGKVKNVEAFDQENALKIPKIGVLAPLIAADSKEKDLEAKLNRGVVIFPNSALPGQTGQTIILGHSAPTNWPKIKYDWVFSQLNELEEKDEIKLYFNNREYTYYVKDKIFLEKGEEIPNYSTDSGNTLLLISCWPPGKNLKRIVVEAKLNPVVEVQQEFFQRKSFKKSY
jgi:LPXTG-site transpeptidase (sortase) family protein